LRQELSKEVVMSNKISFTRTLVILGIASLLFLTGCGGNQPQQSTPMITTISPNSSVAGGVAFTLTINGTNFISASTVNFGGVAPATTFVSSTQLAAAIPAGAIASAGTAAVTVTNPAPGGGTSNAVNFTISNGPNPVPTIGFLSPSCAPAGEQILNPFVNGQLFVDGHNFVADSVVRWNGNDRPTTFYSSSQLTVQISVSDISAAGAATVTVFNPAPGGGSSNTSTFTITAGGVSPQSVAVDPTGKFAYVANEGCGDSTFGNVSMYTIDATSGALASIGPPIASNDEGGRAVIADPSGKFAYVVNWGEGDTAGGIATYTINATTGALTATGTIYAACPGLGCSLLAPWSIAVHPSGKFVYVANEGGTGVSMFAIDITTGDLTPTGAIATAGRALSVAVDPTGKFAYVGAGSDSGSAGNVSIYAINATTGVLTSIGTIAAGTAPVVAVDPTGKFVYASNSGSNDVSMYAIDTTTGALTSIGTISAGSTPTSIAVHPSGNFAYVTNSSSNDVSMYTIDGATGALTSIGTIAAGTGPVSVAVDPSGKFAYVANSGSNNVSMYSINATTGALTLIGTIGT
jgi:YVTN family beta-propeller protein